MLVAPPDHAPPGTPLPLTRAQLILLGRLVVAGPTGVPNVFPAAAEMVAQGLAEVYLRGRLRITEAGREYHRAAATLAAAAPKK